MKNKRSNTIAIIGNSLKFIKFIKKNFLYKKVNIFKWRKIEETIKNSSKKYDLIFICGFDFSLYSSKLNYFSQINIYNPLRLIEKISTKKTKIIYINTKIIKKNNVTFSRYKYAKQKLAYLISRKFENYEIINTDLIIQRNKILINSNNISKFFFKVLIYMKLIKAIEMSDLIIDIKQRIKEKKNKKQKNISGKLLNLPRSQFLDRFVRLMLG